MRKLLYLLLVLPFALAFTSCHDDDDLPNVTVTMNFGNAAVKDNVLYVAETDTLTLNSIETRAIDGTKSATLANVRYFWNGIPAPYLTWSNFPLEIPVADMPLVEDGLNYLNLSATLLEIDKSIAYSTINVPIAVVPTVGDIPDGLVPGDVQLVMQIGQSRNQ